MRSQSGLWAAAALLLGGVVWLIDRLDPSAHVLERFGQWWPALLIVVGIGGVARLVIDQNALRGPLLVAITGAVLLLVTSDLIPADAKRLVWPVTLVLAGATLLSRIVLFRPTAQERLITRLVSVGASRRVAWPTGRFSLGTVTALASGCIIDLKAATPLDSKARLDITAIGSGVDLVVPIDWKVDVQSRTLLGRCRDSTGVQVAQLSAPLLHVHALVVFAGVEIRRPHL